MEESIGHSFLFIKVVNAEKLYGGYSGTIFRIAAFVIKSMFKIKNVCFDVDILHH